MGTFLKRVGKFLPYPRERLFCALSLSVGYAFLVVFSTLMDIHSASITGDARLEYARYLAIMVTLLFIGLSSRLASALSKRSLAIVFGIIASLGVFASAFPLGFPSTHQAVTVIGVSLSAIGEAWITMVWFAGFAALRTRSLVTLLAIGNLLAASLLWVIESMAPSSALIVTVLCLAPIVSLLLRMACWQESEASKESDAEGTCIEGTDNPETLMCENHLSTHRSLKSTTKTVPVLPILVLVIFAAANQLARCLIPSETVNYTLFGVVAVCLVVLVIAKSRLGAQIDYLWYIAFPLSIIGLVGVTSEPPVFGVVAAACANASQACFTIFVIAIICNAAFRYDLDAVRIIAFAQAGILLSMEGINLLIQLGDMGNAKLQSLDGTLIILISCLSVALVAGTNLDLTQKLKSSGDVITLKGSQTLEFSCSSIARKYDLTHREEEILLYLARSWSVPAISEKLYIADSTTRSHVKHLYQKLSIHNREELAGFIRDWNQSRDASDE